MTMRIGVQAGAAVLAGMLATTALAASTAKDPKTMVLQRPDIPGALQTHRTSEKNARLSAYVVAYRYPSGGKQLDVTSSAAVMSPRLATTAFRQVGGMFQGDRKVTLPRYGDQQIAVTAREDNEGQLYVRKGGTVWSLTVNTAAVGNWGLITRAQSIAQLRALAPKQMRRVGSG